MHQQVPTGNPQAQVVKPGETVIAFHLSYGSFQRVRPVQQNRPEIEIVAQAARLAIDHRMFAAATVPHFVIIGVNQPGIRIPRNLQHPVESEHSHPQYGIAGIDQRIIPRGRFGDLPERRRIAQRPADPVFALIGRIVLRPVHPENFVYRLFPAQPVRYAFRLLRTHTGQKTIHTYFHRNLLLELSRTKIGQNPHDPNRRTLFYGPVRFAILPGSDSTRRGSAGSRFPRGRPAIPGR